MYDLQGIFKLYNVWVTDPSKPFACLSSTKKMFKWNGPVSQLVKLYNVWVTEPSKALPLSQ